ncbi:hypothetical protein HDZ31DRAFT_62885 [Schizophyllum fasciatum]
MTLTSSRMACAVVGWDKKADENQKEAFDSRKWQIEHARNGYTVKNVGHGMHLGFAHGEGKPFDAQGFAMTKEADEWQVEADDKDASLYRFSVPGTNLHSGSTVQNIAKDMDLGDFQVTWRLHKVDS